jgi:hypothetical protein
MAYGGKVCDNGFAQGGTTWLVPEPRSTDARVPSDASPYALEETDHEMPVDSTVQSATAVSPASGWPAKKPRQQNQAGIPPRHHQTKYESNGRHAKSEQSATAFLKNVSMNRPPM